MSRWEALMDPETKMPIKCPIRKEDSCNNHCAWFDTAHHQCVTQTIGAALTELAHKGGPGQTAPRIQ